MLKTSQVNRKKETSNKHVMLNKDLAFLFFVNIDIFAF